MRILIASRRYKNLEKINRMEDAKNIDFQNNNAKQLF